MSSELPLKIKRSSDGKNIDTGIATLLSFWTWSNLLITRTSQTFRRCLAFRHYVQLVLELFALDCLKRPHIWTCLGYSPFIFFSGGYGSLWYQGWKMHSTEWIIQSSCESNVKIIFLPRSNLNLLISETVGPFKT